MCSVEHHNKETYELEHIYTQSIMTKTTYTTSSHANTCNNGSQGREFLAECSPGRGPYGS